MSPPSTFLFQAVEFVFEPAVPSSFKRGAKGGSISLLPSFERVMIMMMSIHLDLSSRLRDDQLITQLSRHLS